MREVTYPVKATGIVRRIDELGRIVIPIEIRRTMNIREGDPLEIFVDRDGEVILKKYSAIAELGEFAQAIVESLNESTGLVAMMADRDEVVAVAGATPREVLAKRIGPVVLKAMDDRETLTFTTKDHRHAGSVIGDEMERCVFASEVIAPIVVGGDPLGAVILATKDPARDFGDLEIKLTEAAAGFLSRHMEE